MALCGSSRLNGKDAQQVYLAVSVGAADALEHLP